VGFENHWSTLTPGARISEEPWSTDVELAQTTALVIFAGVPTEDQETCFQDLAKHLREHPLAAPPVLLVPLVGRSNVADVRGWVERLVRHSIVDDAVWGTPAGYALALSVQAKLLSVSVQLDRLAEEVDKRTDVADEKEHLLETMEYMRWQYPRSRLFRAIPPTHPEPEEDNRVLGYTLGRKISRGAFGIVRSATSGRPQEAQSQCTGMLVVDKHKSVRSFGDMMVINTFLTVMDRLSRSPHSNVTRLLQCYSSPKHLFVCLQLAGPQTLFTRLCQRDSPARGAAPLALSSASRPSRRR